MAFASLLVAWLAYEALCRSAARPPRDRAWRRSATASWSRSTYGFTHVFSGRGAFTQIGALIGTIMVANVFIVIIPNQKKTVAATGRRPQTPDPAQSGDAKQAALGAQQLPDAAGRVPDDLQPLSAPVRDPLQLADRRRRARHRAV